MIRSVRAALGTVLVVALTLAGLAVAVPASAVGSPVPVVVDLKAGTSPAAFARKLGIEPTHVYTEFMSGFSAEVTPDQLEKLKTDRRVLTATMDRVIGRIPTTQRKKVGQQSVLDFASFVGDLPPGSDGTDQFVPAEIRRVRADESSTADIDGLPNRVDVDVAVFESGVDATHPDLNVVGGYNCVGRRGDRAWNVDLNGHGTFVAGQLAALDNNLGIVGVAPGARVHSVVVGDAEGSISASDYLCGMDWANRMAPRLEVVNLSLEFEDDGTGACRRTNTKVFDRYEWTVCRLVNRGVTVVAAAGNGGQDATSIAPAFYEDAITVSAIFDYDGAPGGLSSPRPECFPDGDVDDTFASFFSNFGEPVDVAAPGVCNISTWPDNRFAVAEGTSFATPLVAGGAALLMARHPRWTPGQVRAKIIETAEPGPISGDPDEFPEGILDVSTF